VEPIKEDYEEQFEDWQEQDEWSYEEE